MESLSNYGTSLYVQEKGSGPALVFMHGFPLNHHMWDAQIAEFSSRWRVLAPDLPGFGHSRPPAPFTMESLADKIHLLLEGRKALPCVLAGLSMGGYVALAYARKYPADLRGLILADTKAEADTPEGKEGRQKMIELARMQGSKAVAEKMLEKMLSPDTRDHRPDQVKALREMMEVCPALTIEYALAAMRNRPDMSCELPSIPAPTLILVGDADAITPPSVAEAMRQQIPRARCVVIQGAGHMSPVEQPAQVNRAIRQFLEGLD